MKAFNKIMVAVAAMAMATGLTGCDYLDKIGRASCRERVFRAV